MADEQYGGWLTIPTYRPGQTVWVIDHDAYNQRYTVATRTLVSAGNRRLTVEDRDGTREHYDARTRKRGQFGWGNEPPDLYPNPVDAYTEVIRRTTEQIAQQERELADLKRHLTGLQTAANQQ